MKQKQNNRLGLDAAVGKLEKHFQQGLKLVREVQSEALLELHLGKMDLKKRWAALGADLSSAEHDALQRAPPAVDNAIKALRSLRHRASKAAAKRAPAAARR
jgi:hypothetical protein